MITLYFQGGTQTTAYKDLGERYGIETDIADADWQNRLEEVRSHLKREIQKELKIKEGAENLRKATTDKKSLANVNSLVKQANNKLQELQHELNELNAHLLYATSNSTTAKSDTITGKKIHTCFQMLKKFSLPFLSRAVPVYIL